MAPWTHDSGKDKNPSFAVKREHGDAFCNCFSCNYHGKLSDLVIDMQTRNKIDPQVKIKWSDAMALLDEDADESIVDLHHPDIEELLMSNANAMHEFPEWWLGSFNQWYEVPQVAKYVTEERGFDSAILSAHELRADSKQNRICFPVRDFRGKLMGLHGRAVNPAIEPRYRMYLQAGKNNPLVWYGEEWADPSRPLVIVEGPFDVLSVRRVYSNVVSPLFANPNFEKIKRMGDFFEQFTFFDHGKGGDAGRNKFTKANADKHILGHIMPPDGIKDPGACTVDELVDILSPHLQLDMLWA